MADYTVSGSIKFSTEFFVASMQGAKKAANEFQATIATLNKTLATAENNLKPAATSYNKLTAGTKLLTAEQVRQTAAQGKQTSEQKAATATTKELEAQTAKRTAADKKATAALTLQTPAQAGLTTSTGKLAAAQLNAAGASRKMDAGLGGASQSVNTFDNHIGTIVTAGYLTQLSKFLLRGAGAAIGFSADFQVAMSRTKAALSASGDDAVTLSAQMGKLRDTAIEAGARTKFSAAEAAQGMAELSKAGISAAGIYSGALDAALNLAASGNLNVAKSAELVGTAMVQFNLKGSDATHIADLMAAAANTAAGDVSDMALALSQAGPVANRVGWSIEEVTGAITGMASAGVIGRKAGTSLRAMMARMVAPTAKAASVAKELGISFYNASGGFKSAEEVAGMLQKQLSDSSPELLAYGKKMKMGGEQVRNMAFQTLFLTDASAAATMFYNQGATGIANYTEQVDQYGYAAMQARIQTDNFTGDVERLGGAVETLFTNSNFSESIRPIVQTLDNLVSSLNEADPAAIQGFIIALTTLGVTIGAVAVRMKVGVAVHTFLAMFTPEQLASKGIATHAFAKALNALQAAGTKLVLPLTAVVAVLALAGAAWAIHTNKVENAKRKAEEIGETLNTTTGAITKQTTALVMDKLVKIGAAEAAEKLGIGLDIVAAAALGSADAQFILKNAIARAKTNTSEWDQLIIDTGGDLDNYSGSAIKAVKATDEQSDAANKLSGVTDEYSAALTAAQEKLKEDARLKLVGETAAKRFGIAISGATEDILANTAALLDNMAKEREAAKQKRDAASGYAGLVVSAGDATAAYKKLTKAEKAKIGGMDESKAKTEEQRIQVAKNIIEWNTQTDALIASSKAAIALDGSMGNTQKVVAQATLTAEAHGKMVGATKEEILEMVRAATDFTGVQLTANASVLAGIKATSEYVDGQNANIDAYIATAKGAGMSRQAAIDYMNALGRIPTDIETVYKAQVVGYETAESILAQLARNREAELKVRVTYITASGSAAIVSRNQGPTLINPGSATGGSIYGLGGPMEDNLLSRVSNREFVLRAKWADKYRNQMNYLNTFGKWPGYATGGTPGQPRLTYSPNYISGGGGGGIDMGALANAVAGAVVSGLNGTQFNLYAEGREIRAIVQDENRALAYQRGRQG